MKTYGQSAQSLRGARTASLVCQQLWPALSVGRSVGRRESDRAEGWREAGRKGREPDPRRMYVLPSIRPSVRRTGNRARLLCKY